MGAALQEWQIKQYYLIRSLRKRVKHLENELDYLKGVLSDYRRRIGLRASRKNSQRVHKGKSGKPRNVDAKSGPTPADCGETAERPG